MTVPALRVLAAAFASVVFALPAHAQGPAASPAAKPFEPATTAAALAAPSPMSSATAKGEPRSVWSQVYVSGQYIAMTFDDGPSAALTPQLLDILKARNMHVTFFVLGEMVKPHPEIIKRAAAEGHEIGNHSWDHPDLAKKSDEEVRSQLNRTKDVITEALHKPVTLMRPPYGSLSSEQKRLVHGELGYTIVLWDVDPEDWKVERATKERPAPSVIEDRIVQHTHNGSIILSHDIHPHTVAAMPDTFDKLLAKGFKFVTVSELLAMNQPELEKHPPAKGAAGGKEHPAGTPTKSSTPSNLPDKINGAPGQ